MSNKTLIQVLSKLKHGTIIRHSENFDEITYNGHNYFSVKVGERSTLFVNKKEIDLLKPFIKYCIYFKVKGKTGFYHCEENGLFNMDIKFSTLTQFATENIKNIYPSLNTLIFSFNHLEYYCKDTNNWIKLSDYPI
jgi:hypothetical protein